MLSPVIRDFLRTRAVHSAQWVALLAGAYAAVIVYLDPVDMPPRRYLTDAAIALGMGLLLAIRINRAYERWWEARKLWGTLVNLSRNLAVKAKAFEHPAPDEARGLEREIAGFAFGFRDHLRAGASLGRVPGWQDADAQPAHVPSWIVGKIYERIRGWSEAGRITPEEMRTLDLEARGLLDVCGACERIRNTPPPPGLPAISRIIILIAILGLPWAAEDVSGWWTVVITAGAALMLVIGETLATVMEHPFGEDPNQLDLTGLCHVIDDTVAEILEVEPVARGF